MKNITSYKHTFVKMNDDLSISDMKEVICAEKMGRERQPPTWNPTAWRGTLWQR